MPRTGGIYSEPSGTKGVTLQTIQSGKYNAWIDDIKNVLNSPAPLLAGGTGASTADGAAEALGLVSAKDLAGVNTVGGTANAITIVTSRDYDAYENTLYLTFIAGADIAGGGTTIDLDGNGAKPLYKVVAAGLVDVNAGDIITAGRYTVTYDTTADGGDGAFILLNPGNASSAYQVGDYLDTLRTLNSDWLRRNGSVYDIDDYPELAALLPVLPDTVLWSNLTSGTSSAIRAFKFANDKYVAVGVGGLILVSDDRETWTTKTSGTVQDLIGVEYGNGVWVAFAQNGTVCVSSDTETWSTTSIGGSFAALSIAFGNGLFVIGGAISGVSAIVNSANGTSWSANKLAGGALGGGVWSLCFNGTMFLGGCQGAGANNVAYRSTDGNTWSSSVTGAGILFRSIATDGTTFVMVGDNGVIISTTNGTSFTARTSGVATALYGVAYASPVGWMAVGINGVAQISSNLSSWVAGGATGTTSTLYAVLTDPDVSGLYIVGGAGGLLKKGQRTLPTQFQVPDDNPTRGWIKAVS